MSEELEWELIEIFESGLFAFPIYDHMSARKFVRYLLARGVLEEEIAEAIEDTTIDLSIWLNHAGKFMVGEWVIAWLNETRDEYELEKDRDMGSDYEGFFREVSPDGTLDTEDQTTEDGSETGLKGYRSFDHADGDTATTHVISEASSHSTGVDDIDKNQDDDESLWTTEGTPPPLPPRSPKERQRLSYNKKFKDKESFQLMMTEQSMDLSHYLDELCDKSSTTSGLYTTIPSDKITDIGSLELTTFKTKPLVTLHHHSNNSDSIKNQRNSLPHPHSKHNGDITLHSSLPLCLPKCTDCSCTIAYTVPKDSTIQTLADSTYCDLYITDTQIRAMEIDLPTLDRDGPGYLYIMTDILHHGLSWAMQHRYKIASSRQPERCLTEYRSRNVDIELLWQVKVRRHLKAVKEVHSNLQAFNIHSNWFRCALSEIMDVISKTAVKYKADLE